MTTQRRVFLKGTLAASAVGLTGTGFLTSGQALAARPDSAFQTEQVEQAMRMIAGTDAPDGGNITLDTPEVAQNASAVPVTIESVITDTREIALLVSQGTVRPLNSTYVLGSRALPYISTRIKMGETADLIAVAKTDTQAHSVRAQVIIPEGDGCV